MKPDPQGSASSGRVLDLAVIVLFLAAITAPLVDLLVRPGEVRSPLVREKRLPAAFPELEWSLPALMRFPEGFEAWWGDCFGLRDALIRGHSLAYLGFGRSPRPDVEMGRDGWMFLFGGQTLELQRGLLPLSDEELERWRQLLVHQQAQLAQRGIQYLFVLAPDKPTIYADLLPAGMQALGPTRMEQLYEYLRRHSDLWLLDLRPALQAERAGDRPDDTVYFKYGTHWYGRGAYRAYAEIVRTLAQRFPQLEPLPLSELQLGPGLQDSFAESAYVGDLLPQDSSCYAPRHPRAQLLGQRSWWKMHMLRSQVDDARLPSALLLHDSMGEYVEGLLAEHFARMSTCWSHEFDISSIEEQRPDVVIVLYVERVLDTPPPLPVGLPQELAAEFERAPRHLLELAPVRVAQGFDREGTPVLAPHADGAGLEIRTKKSADFVILPAFEVPADGHVLLQLEIECPIATMLALWSKNVGEEHYSPDSRVRRDLEPGLNRLCIELWQPGIDGRLRLRPGLLAGTYVLRSYQVRAP